MKHPIRAILFYEQNVQALSGVSDTNFHKNFFHPHHHLQATTASRHDGQLGRSVKKDLSKSILMDLKVCREQQEDLSFMIRKTNFYKRQLLIQEQLQYQWLKLQPCIMGSRQLYKPDLQIFILKKITTFLSKQCKEKSKPLRKFKCQFKMSLLSLVFSTMSLLTIFLGKRIAQPIGQRSLGYQFIPQVCRMRLLMETFIVSLLRISQDEPLREGRSKL